MSITSFSFFVFLFISVILYYISGTYKKYVLLFASCYFYLSISSVNKFKLIVVMLMIWLVTYSAALLIYNLNGKKKSVVAFSSIFILVAFLFVSKYAYNLLYMVSRIIFIPGQFEWLKFGAIIGVSYFTLSAIGYLVDVHWGLQEAERNPFAVALFIFYFPQVISGPITRFKEMKAQFDAKHQIEYDKITGGLRRMLWGYFKKLVVSERIAMISNEVFGNYTEYSGMIIIIATLAYTIRLYTDFSGCMDIIMGASELFDIRLPENFRAPFFSRSIQEFWQRWHMTLGSWCKDYIMYPIQKSKPMVKLAKKCKKAFGKNLGKKIPFYLSMSVLWFAIGIWHGGTAYWFMASALVPFVLSVASDMLTPLFVKIKKVLQINVECDSWIAFQRIRTMLLVGFGWIFACTCSLGKGIAVIKYSIMNPVKFVSTEILIGAIGFKFVDIVLVLIGMAVIYIDDKLIDKGTDIRRYMNNQNAVIRWTVIYIELFCITLYGMLGSSEFIYFQF